MKFKAGDRICLILGFDNDYLYRGRITEAHEPYYYVMWNVTKPYYLKQEPQLETMCFIDSMFRIEVDTESIWQEVLNEKT